MGLLTLKRRERGVSWRGVYIYPASVVGFKLK